MEISMNTFTSTAWLAAAALSCGCADLTRSRDLANPQVTATTLAQQVCSNCHGVTGQAVSPNFPNLAAQVEAYSVTQLNGFKSHRRQDPAGFEYMWGLSRHLTDDQIKGLAAYYAAQQAANATCHGAEGQGMAMFPRLAGQHADYLVKQLLVFQRTDERPEGSLMKTVAHELTRDDIDNVAAYLQAMGR
jgi:cytochrome c553